MDHKWGRAIWDNGLWSMGATLAARLVVPLPVNYWVTNAIVDGQCVIARVPADELSDVPYLFFGATATPPHFPYFLNVLPDGPV